MANIWFVGHRQDFLYFLRERATQSNATLCGCTDTEHLNFLQVELSSKAVSQSTSSRGFTKPTQVSLSQTQSSASGITIYLMKLH